MTQKRSITRAADWERVRREGSTGRCDGIRVRVVRKPSPELPGRVGLRVRSGGRARAVIRNRVRRRLREAWRLLPEATRVDAVVYADAALVTRDFQGIRHDLERALTEALGEVRR